MSTTNPSLHVRGWLLGLFPRLEQVHAPSLRGAQVLEHELSRRDAPEPELERLLFRRGVPVRVLFSRDDDEPYAHDRVRG